MAQERVSSIKPNMLAAMRLAETKPDQSTAPMGVADLAGSETEGQASTDTSDHHESSETPCGDQRQSWMGTCPPSGESVKRMKPGTPTYSAGQGFPATADTYFTPKHSTVGGGSAG